MSNDELRTWIQEHMTVDEMGLLQQYKEQVARLVGLTPDGRVLVRPEKEVLTSTERVALYLVGKTYSNTVGYSQSPSASNEELARELGLPEGTVRRATTELRKMGWATSTGRGIQTIILNALPVIILRLDAKLTQQSGA